VKAAVVENHGSDVVVAAVDEPALSADSVIIDVRAASVNPIDSVIWVGFVQDRVPLQFPSKIVIDFGASE
jgi:NADPH:quinone reductase-like Zn-dependent oxidoreductase